MIHWAEPSQIVHKSIDHDPIRRRLGHDALAGERGEERRSGVRFGCDLASANDGPRAVRRLEAWLHDCARCLDLTQRALPGDLRSLNDHERTHVRRLPRAWSPLPTPVAQLDDDAEPAGLDTPPHG